MGGSESNSISSIYFLQPNQNNLFNICISLHFLWVIYKIMQEMFDKDPVIALKKFRRAVALEQRELERVFPMPLQSRII